MFVFATANTPCAASIVVTLRRPRFTHFARELGQGFSRALFIERKLSAQQARAAKVAQYKMGVSHRRQKRSAVTGRTWISPC